MKNAIINLAKFHFLRFIIGEPQLTDFPDPNTLLRLQITLLPKSWEDGTFAEIQMDIARFISAFGNLVTEIPFPNQKSDMTGYKMELTQSDDDTYIFTFEPNIES